MMLVDGCAPDSDGHDVYRSLTWLVSGCGPVSYFICVDELGSARETTPCSLVRNSETVDTPGSTTRVSNSGVSSRRIQTSTRRNFPTAQEMEEFFARAEALQQRVFVEKYNFDPVNDLPLPGRYEWVKLDS